MVKGRAPKRRKLKSRPREGWARPFVRNTGEILTSVVKALLPREKNRVDFI